MPVELEEFILKHKNLSGNKILKLYRKSGYHINTQKFYEIKKGIDNRNKKKNINYTTINININDYSKQQKIKRKNKEVKKVNNKKEIKKENKRKNKEVKKVNNKKEIKKENKKVKDKEEIKKVKPVYDKLAHNKIDKFNKIKENKINIKEQNIEVKEEIVLSDKEITENKIKKIILENPNLSKRELFKIIKQNDLHLRQSEILRLKREVLKIPIDESKSHKKEKKVIGDFFFPEGDIYGHLEKWFDLKDLYEALNVIDKGKNIKHSHTKFLMIGAYYYDNIKHYIMYSIQNFNDLKYVLQQIINRRGMNTLIYKMLDCRKGFPNNKFMSGNLTVILE